MKIERMTEIETNDIQIGDRIHVGKYTATCQEITPSVAIFLLDQYLDKPMEMNTADTNNGGYPESDLRKRLQSNEVLNDFKSIRDRMVPFENGDLLRILFAGEIFGDKLPGWCEPDGHEQWPLMQDRRNRLASRCGEYECGWINNKVKSSSTDFCGVDGDGDVGGWNASYAIGVRPVFQISLKKDDTMTQDTVRDVLDTFNETQRETMADWKHTCPICKYDFEHCQCRFAGSAHPDRSIRRRAVLDHLQYLCDEQIDHIQKVEEWWSTSGEGEYQEVVEELKREYDG